MDIQETKLNISKNFLVHRAQSMSNIVSYHHSLMSITLNNWGKQSYQGDGLNIKQEEKKKNVKNFGAEDNLEPIQNLKVNLRN